MNPLETGDGAQAIDINQVFDRYRNVVKSGCDPTLGSGDYKVDIASGTVVVAGTEHSISATTKTLSTAGTDPRKDVIYVDSSGSVAVAQGAEAPAQPTGEVRRDTYQPSPPDLSGTDACVLAEVWVAEPLVAGDIIDRRLLADAEFDDLVADTVTTEEVVIKQGHGFLGLPNHHVNYASGLSNEEISRFTLDSGDVLELWRLECQLKGGGTNSNVAVEVFDATNSSSLGSVTAGSRSSGGSSPIGTSGVGATILVRLSTGSNAVDIATTGITNVVSQ